MSGDPVDEVQRLLQEQRTMYESRLTRLRQQQQRQTTPNLGNGTPTIQPASEFSRRRLAVPEIPSIPPLLSPRSLFAINKPFIPGKQKKYLRSTSCQPLEPGAQNERRARSASRSRSHQNKKENAAIKCPTCKKVYGVYIFQCGDGHSSCKDCKTKGACCGVCGKSITDMRNITLEAYLSERIILCPNSSEGCSLYFKPEQMETHIKECPYKEQACPIAAGFGKCSWKGNLSQMVSHFNNNHPETRKGSVNTELLISNMAKNSTTVYFIDIGSYYFLVYVKVDETQIYMTVQLVGTSVSASKWSYEFHFYNKNKPRRKYQYSDICQPYCSAVEEMFKEARCMVIPRLYAAGFVNKGCLAYKLFLNKERGTGWSNN